MIKVVFDTYTKLKKSGAITSCFIFPKNRSFKVKEKKERGMFSFLW